MVSKKSVVAVLIAAPIFSMQAAHASTLSAGPGVGYASGVNNPSTNLGLDYTIKISDTFETGGGMDYTFLKYKDNAPGSLKFYYLMARFKIGGMGGLYVDGKFGAEQRSANNDYSGYALAAGVGMSYRIPLGERWALSPRIGVRYLPNFEWSEEPAPTGAMVDIGLQISFRF